MPEASSSAATTGPIAATRVTSSPSRSSASRFLSRASFFSRCTCALLVNAIASISRARELDYELDHLRVLGGRRVHVRRDAVGLDAAPAQVVDEPHVLIGRIELDSDAPVRQLELHQRSRSSRPSSAPPPRARRRDRACAALMKIELPHGRVAVQVCTLRGVIAARRLLARARRRCRVRGAVRVRIGRRGCAGDRAHREAPQQTQWVHEQGAGCSGSRSSRERKTSTRSCAQGSDMTHCRRDRRGGCRARRRRAFAWTRCRRRASR